MRLWVQWAWAEFLWFTGCLWWAKRRLLDDGAVIVLTLHRVLDEVSYGKTNCLPGIVVRERTFRKLIDYIQRRCEAVDLLEAAPGKPSSKLQIVLTFDDGWSDNYSIVFPIVSANHIPMTVFVCSGLVGKKSPFWPERARALMKVLQPKITEMEVSAKIDVLKECDEVVRDNYLTSLSERARREGKTVEASNVDRLLTWEEIAAMNHGGIRFGSHTHTHQILTTVCFERANDEVRVSKAALEAALNRNCDTFAYPNGNRSAATRRMLVEAGYKLAATTERGAWKAAGDPLAIRRSNVCEGDLTGLAGQFSPAMFEYTTFWKAWRTTKASTHVGVAPQEQPVSAAL